MNSNVPLGGGSTAQPHITSSDLLNYGFSLKNCTASLRANGCGDSL